MTDPATTDEVARIAAGLTKAQRAALRRDAIARGDHLRGGWPDGCG